VKVFDDGWENSGRLTRFTYRIDLIPRTWSEIR
jgi:hypothetical protein